MPAPPKSRKWTAAERAELHRLARTLTPRAIADALGRTVTAVRMKAAHERIPLLPTPHVGGPPRRRMPWDYEESEDCDD